MPQLTLDQHSNAIYIHMRQIMSALGALTYTAQACWQTGDNSLYSNFVSHYKAIFPELNNLQIRHIIFFYCQKIC